MSFDLSLGANDLVCAAQAALRPSVVDRTRVFAALQRRLLQQPTPTEVEATPATSGKPAQPAAIREPIHAINSVTLGKLTALVLAALVSFGAFSLCLTPLVEEAVEPRASILAPAAPSIESSATAVAQSDEGAQPQAVDSAAPASVEVLSERTVPHVSGTAVRKLAEDNLGQEVAILSRAEKALHAGNLTGALALTAEHGTRFPDGLMVQERVNIRAHALCGLGREPEADREYARLRRMTKLVAGEACRR